jgi:hypothetical protein
MCDRAPGLREEKSRVFGAKRSDLSMLFRESEPLTQRSKILFARKLPRQCVSERGRNGRRRFAAVDTKNVRCFVRKKTAFPSQIEAISDRCSVRASSS